MRYIKLSFITTIIVLNFSCSQLTGASEHAIALDRAIQTMNDAVNLCRQAEDSRKVPNSQELKIMSEFSNETIFTYIKYRSYINLENCLIQHGATPKDYLAAVAFDDNVDYFTRKKAKNYFETLLQHKIVENINYINSLPEKERIALQQIEYLNENFDLTDTSNTLMKYKKIIP